MQISLDRKAELPLRTQLAEQIVFLITTGELRPGQQLPSVRALARLAKIHHNTVSGAYQDLVRRKWLTRKRGSRLVVGSRSGDGLAAGNVDELINETIQRAGEMGYSLQALTERVSERLLAQPPDHVLIVEDEAGLREIIRREVEGELGCLVEGCSVEQFVKTPGLAVGAQLFAPNHLIDSLRAHVPADQPATPIVYSAAHECIELIRRLQKPSVVAVVSISESLLKTAEGLLAPALGRRHSFRGLLAPREARADLRGADVVFCDSVVLPAVRSRVKIHYQLVADRCLEHLAQQLGPVRPRHT